MSGLLNEPDCGWNLPPGCFGADVGRAFYEPKTCGDCSHLLECRSGSGVCEIEFEEAFNEAGRDAKASPWKAVCWARDWIADHCRDMQEAACERCDG